MTKQKYAPASLLLQRNQLSVFKCSIKEKLIAIYKCKLWIYGRHVSLTCILIDYEIGFQAVLERICWHTCDTVLFVSSGHSDILITGICRPWTGSIPGYIIIMKWFLLVHCTSSITMLKTIGRFAFIYSKNKAVKQYNYEKMNHGNKRLFKLTSFVIQW